MNKELLFCCIFSYIFSIYASPIFPERVFNCEQIKDPHISIISIKNTNAPLEIPFIESFIVAAVMCMSLPWNAQPLPNQTLGINSSAELACPKGQYGPFCSNLTTPM